MDRHRWDVFALLLLAGTGLAVGGPAPGNDHPEDATRFTSVPFVVEQDMRGATLDDGERPACDDERDDTSVWFRYEPEDTHRLVLDTRNSTGDVDLAVFDEVGALLDCDEHGSTEGGVDARLHVEVTAGQRYLIQVTAHDTDILRFTARTYEPFRFDPVVQARGWVEDGTAYVRVDTRCNDDAFADGFSVTVAQGAGPVAVTGATDWHLYCTPDVRARPDLPVVDESGGAVTVRPSAGGFVVGPVAVELAGVACNASPRYRECVEFDVSAVQLLRPFGTAGR